MDGYRTGYQECKENNSNDSENDDDKPSSSVNSDCFNEGYDDGKDNPFSLEKYRDCGGSMGAGNNGYYNGFVAGCLSVSGNTAALSKYLRSQRQGNVVVFQTSGCLLHST
jgi:hypothetical protein